MNVANSSNPVLVIIYLYCINMRCCGLIELSNQQLPTVQFD